MGALRWALIAAVALAEIACSRPRDRDSAVSAPPVAATSGDAHAMPPDAEPQWLASALARGGPGLCAVISDANVLVWRRDADGRPVERLEFNAEHGAEPAERIEFGYASGRLSKMVRRGSTYHSFDSTIDVWYDKAGRIERRRQHYDDATALLPGDVNVTFRWKGKQLTNVVGQFLPVEPEDPTQPLVYALAFTGTVHEAHHYDGSPAPQPQSEYTNTYDARGRLVDITSTGWSDPSRHEQLEWDADDQLIAIRTGLSVTEFVWRDHRVVSTRHLDQTGKEVDHWELHYDASGRLVEKVRYAPPGGTRERIASSVVDRERGELVTTYVTEDEPAPLARWSYRYDCGSAAP